MKHDELIAPVVKDVDPHIQRFNELKIERLRTKELMHAWLENPEYFQVDHPQSPDRDGFPQGNWRENDTLLPALEDAVDLGIPTREMCQAMRADFELNGRLDYEKRVEKARWVVEMSEKSGMEPPEEDLRLANDPDRYHSLNRWSKEKDEQKIRSRDWQRSPAADRIRS